MAGMLPLQASHSLCCCLPGVPESATGVVPLPLPGACPLGTEP